MIGRPTTNSGRGGDCRVKTTREGNPRPATRAGPGEHARKTRTRSSPARGGGEPAMGSGRSRAQAAAAALQRRFLRVRRTSSPAPQSGQATVSMSGLLRVCGRRCPRPPSVGRTFLRVQQVGGSDRCQRRPLRRVDAVKGRLPAQRSPPRVFSRRTLPQTWEYQSGRVSRYAAR